MKHGSRTNPTILILGADYDSKGPYMIIAWKMANVFDMFKHMVEKLPIVIWGPGLLINPNFERKYISVTPFARLLMGFGGGRGGGRSPNKPLLGHEYAFFWGLCGLPSLPPSLHELRSKFATSRPSFGAAWPKAASSKPSAAAARGRRRGRDEGLLPVAFQLWCILPRHVMTSTFCQLMGFPC